jgi:hypothetical protein
MTVLRATTAEGVPEWLSDLENTRTKHLPPIKSSR